MGQHRSAQPDDGIAVVGMGCRFAGASELQGYWSMLVEGRDGFGPIPADRWDFEAFHDPNPRASDKSYAVAGGFIDDVRSFPAVALQIPPRRVEVMDPQQRFTLEIALQAVEDAGYQPGQIPTNTGVYVGVTAMEYRTLVGARITAQLMATGATGQAPDEAELLNQVADRVIPPRPFTAPGLLSNMIAATVAQELRLRGPAYTVDAACASGLVALSDAFNALRSGQVDAALAGGVYLCLTPEHHIAFSRVGAMSRQGMCLPFDARADGFVEGDGVGMLLLKRVEDARRDGDRIYGVIRGVGMNNDGGGEGPMAPVKSGQVDVIRRAWAQAALSPEALGYVEAHGTGTSVGDKIEFDGLMEALGSEARDVVLGSSKANVGHTMSTAGIAGLMRALLAMHHRVRPPMANFEAAKEDLALNASPFRIPTQAEPWESEHRVAAVSSFGFGGTNVHVVLESDESPTVASDQPELICMSAPDMHDLKVLAKATADALELDLKATVAGVSRAWSGRPAQKKRLTLVAQDRDELIAQLREVEQGLIPQGAALGEAVDNPKVAFLYPGQGAQRIGMLRAIRDRFPEVAAALEEMDDAVAGLMERPVTHLLYPELRPQPVSDDAAMDELTATQNCQPALIAVGLALTELLRQLGIEPAVVAGHSVGEFTAAAAGGVMTPVDAVRFVAERGRAMGEMKGDTGAMVALVCDAETAGPLLTDDAVVANVNHPNQVVISGSTDAISEVTRRAEQADIKAVPLAVSHGFHSPIFDDLDLSHVIDALTLNDPKVPVSSCIFDHPYTDAEEARRVFTAHATSPVIFTTALENCQRFEPTLYLQVGAGGPLRSFTRGTLGNAAPVYSLASREDDDGGRSLLATLGQLWVHGVTFDQDRIRASSTLASVPPTVLPREVYWAVKDTPGVALKLAGASQGAAPSVASEAASVEAVTPTGLTIAETVMMAVARTSAYPREALRPGMTLGDDLGFDSMMVADLIEDITKAVDGLDGIPQELLVNSPSIQDLIDYAENPQHEPVEVDDDAPLGAYRPTWVTTPLVDMPRRAVTEGALAWIGGAESTWTAPVAAHLEAAGFTLSTDLHASVSLAVWLCDNSEPTPLGAVLSGETNLPDAAGAFLTAMSGRATANQDLDVVVVGRDDDTWFESYAGAARALGKEWPGRLIKAVRVDPALSGSLVGQHVVNEILVSDTSADVRYGLQSRMVAGAEVTQPIATRWTPSAQDTFLITGGLRGIGLQVARRVSASGAQVLLLGRGAPSDEATRLMASSEGRVVSVRADVTDIDSLTSALSGYAPTALIHSAGVLADGAVEAVSVEDGAKVRAVKVSGLINAITACGSSLKVAMGIGSWAGRFGSRHQTHYAAANAQMSAIIAALPPRLRGVASEFGPWTNSAMVSTIPESVRASMRRSGVDFVGDVAGLDAVLDDLYESSGVVIRGRRVPMTTRRAGFTETLHTETHPYLLDHAIDGKPVLPLAAATDLLVYASGRMAPFEVSDLQLYQGVAVDNPVSIALIAEGDQVELRQGADDTLSYRARVTAMGEQPAVPELSKAQEAPTLSLTEFYNEVTFHGPLLQGIESIDGVGANHVCGTLRVGRPDAWMTQTVREQWRVDPLVFDSAMQLCAYVAWTRFGRAGTPVGFQRYVQLAPLPESGRLNAQVVFGEQDGDRFTATITLFAPDSSTPLVVVEEVVAQLVEVERDTPADFEIKPEWTDVTQWKGYKDLKFRLQGAEMLGLGNPYFDVHEGTAKNTSMIEGREVINFSSYNYLGLSGDDRIIGDVHQAMKQYGTSVSASRVASGQRPFHADLEQGLAKALGVEDAIAFPSGHATNVTTIGHLFGPKDLIIHDELIHDSCLQGIKLSGAARRGFRHDDVSDLRGQLRELRGHYEKVLILVEGVYSMDGDVASLPDFISVKEEFGTMLMVDEAHSFGTLGRTGCGIREHFDIDPMKVDIWMGTMSKSLASMGGWIAGRKELIEFMRYTTPGFVFAAGMTPTLGQAALSALGLMFEEPWRVTQLQSRAKFFCDALKANGIDTGLAVGDSPVLPAITGDSMQALRLSHRLLERGINAKPIIFPAVANDAARLRLFMCALHTEDELTYTAETIAQTLEEVRAELKR